MNIAERVFSYDQWINNEVGQFRQKFNEIPIRNLRSMIILSTELSKEQGVKFILLSTHDIVFFEICQLLGLKESSIDYNQIKHLGIELGNETLTNEF